jgi:hypothetical protein
MLVESLRSFGGPLSQAPFWLFDTNPKATVAQGIDFSGVEVFPLEIPPAARDNWFGGKVSACACAEEMVTEQTKSLVWCASDCLFINPPHLFDLESSFDVALRPVHIQNIGLPADDPPDDFWQRIYETVEVTDVEMIVESFVDAHRIRAYFNSHSLAVNPDKGIFRRWLADFSTLVQDQVFQAGPCRYESHQIFLHQAILSTLIVSMTAVDRLRILPPEYCYPYNLQESIPKDRRASVLNELVSITCEDRTLDPDLVTDIIIHEPLRSWLADRKEH